MTEEAQGKGKLDAAQAVSIGFIEKAWEFKWGIQLIYIALYADTVLAWFLHKNLLSVTTNTTHIWESIGGLLIAVAGFCLTVSLIIPMVSGLLKAVVMEFAPNFLFSAFRERGAEPDEVSLHYLHTEALRTNDDFLMTIYREKSSIWNRKLRDQQQAATLLIGLMLLTIADIWAGYTSDTQTLILWVARGYEVPFYLYLALAVFTLPVFAILTPWPRAYVYHPRLRRKQDQENKELYGSDGITR
ncbi:MULTISPECIES: hypothetical protein [unclassified Pseudomonas]|uniref:hypothetical protein n=1 Tax=unclassified Pseudomonas TaxID=196821 RepID=UPI002A35AAA6|nr:MULTISPECIES: hypothetical protein [unclassified Pseudomonas]MDX9669552.1 hypothetical protein [Pseudomonas sp. P8_250]WPN36412.1 hypothetical protein QMK53_01785 [Pseudomonas sp. P8_139]WPN41787.1 hypothetical protein QMK55_01085 [Pseudomonas sp. P8_229]